MATAKFLPSQSTFTQVFSTEWGSAEEAAQWSGRRAKEIQIIGTTAGLRSKKQCRCTTPSLEILLLNQAHLSTHLQPSWGVWFLDDYLAEQIHCFLEVPVGIGFKGRILQRTHNELTC